jgi:mono/diheme cytochrome c family protein
MRSLTLSACILLLVSALACDDAQRHEGQWPVSRQELERGSKPEAPGAAIYRQYCTGCHGIDGRGNGAVTGADFTGANSPLLTKSDAELLLSVRDGKRGTTATMPPHKPVLTDAQITSVLAYVRAQFKPAAAAQTP